MVAIQEEWQFVFTVPNLAVGKAIGNQYILIAPLDDPRVQLLVKKHTGLEYLVNGFTDQFKRHITPSVLIFKNCVPSYNINDAVIDFRNIFAVSCIVKAWQDFLIRGQWFTHAAYSEYFDFYPIFPSKDPKTLLIMAPGVRGMDRAEDFVGQTTPGLAGQEYDVKYDSDIFNSLSLEWERCYIQRKSADWNTIVLFRSLRVAYQACSIPIANYSSIYDLGSSLALWVSAFEILAHPSNANVEEEKVLKLIANFPVKSSRLSPRLYKIKGRQKQINLPQKIYHQIHCARNDFLHGNPVDMKRLYPWFNTKRYSLNFFAPLLYKLVLICFLRMYSKTVNLYDLPYEQYATIKGLEDALLKSTTNIEAVH